jgi:hypothetical protein
MTVGHPLITEGLYADGVLIDGAAPLGKLWFPLEASLTVLYGRNGVGKTLLLNAIADGFRGVASPTGLVSLHLSPATHYGGFDEQLVKEIYPALVMSAVDSDGLSAGHPIKRQDYGEEDDESYWLALLDDMRTRIWRLAEPFGLRDGSAHSPRLALVARGTTAKPSWETYISVVPSDPESFVGGLNLRSDEGAHAPRNAVQAIEEPSTAGAPVIVERVGWAAGGSRMSTAVGKGSRRLIGCLTADDELDVNAETLRLLVGVAEVDEGVPLLIESLDGTSVTLSTASDNLAAFLRAEASLVFEALTGRPMRLRLVVTPPNEWLAASPVHWEGEDEYGAVLPIGSLGSGWSRWARLAVALAIARVPMRDDLPSIIIVDEPERALHTAAQRDVARAFVATLRHIELGSAFVHSAIVATHSPAFLAQPGAQLMHLSRSTNRMLQLNSIDPTDEVVALTASLGITEADALLMTRWFVYVEGEHDVAVLQACFHETLADRHALVIPMNGASNLSAFVSARFVLTYSDARIRVVLDRIGAGSGVAWDEATEALARSDRDAARSALERIGRRTDKESRWLYEAGMAAMEGGYFSRIDVVGLDEPDIINYLPVESFVPGAPSWQSLFRDWNKTGRNRPFKQWLNASKGANIHPDRLAEVVAGVSDLRDLVSVVKGLT